MTEQVVVWLEDSEAPVPIAQYLSNIIDTYPVIFYELSNSAMMRYS